MSDKPTKAPETQEQKEYKAAIQLKAVSARKLKVQFEKVRSEVKKAKELEQKILDKGYPREMLKYMLEQLDVVAAKAEENAKYYAAEIIKSDPADTEAVTQVATEFDQHTKALDEALSTTQKSTIQDLKNLAKPAK